MWLVYFPHTFIINLFQSRKEIGLQMLFAKGLLCHVSFRFWWFWTFHSQCFSSLLLFHPSQPSLHFLVYSSWDIFSLYRFLLVMLHILHDSRFKVSSSARHIVRIFFSPSSTNVLFLFFKFPLIAIAINFWFSSSFFLLIFCWCIALLIFVPFIIFSSLSLS